MSVFSVFQNFFYGTSKSHLTSDFFNSLHLGAVLLEVVGDKFIIVNATDAHCKLTSSSREFLISKQIPEAFPNDSQETWKRIKVSFQKAFTKKKPQMMGIERYDLIDPDSGEMVENNGRSKILAYSIPLQMEALLSGML